MCVVVLFVFLLMSNHVYVSICKCVHMFYEFVYTFFGGRLERVDGIFIGFGAYFGNINFPPSLFAMGRVIGKMSVLKRRRKELS